EEQDRETRTDDGPASLQVTVPAAPVIAVAPLLLHEVLAALAIPVVLADEAQAGQAAGPLDAVEGVVQVRLGAQALGGREAPRHPLQGAGHGPVLLVPAAVVPGAVAARRLAADVEV